jgi:IS30 family transposase
MSERIRLAGGIRPTMPTRAARHLTLEEPEQISRGLAARHSIRAIAARLGRCPSTISREVENNGGPASAADRAQRCNGATVQATQAVQAGHDTVAPAW